VEAIHHLAGDRFLGRTKSDVSLLSKDTPKGPTLRHDWTPRDVPSSQPLEPRGLQDQKAFQEISLLSALLTFEAIQLQFQ